MYKYPIVNNMFDDCPLFGKNVYVLEQHSPGISIFYDKGSIRPLNWCCDDYLVIDELFTESLAHIHDIIELFRIIGIDKFQVFYDDTFKIVDCVTDEGFMTYGMLKDIFHKTHDVQRQLYYGTLEKDALNNDNLKLDIENCVIKPQTKLLINNDKFTPYYAKLL